MSMRAFLIEIKNRKTNDHFSFLWTLNRQLPTALLVTAPYTCSEIFWLMIQLFLSICRGAQVWMLIIVLDVAVKFQGKEWDLNSPSDSTACAWNSNPVLFKMMHSSIWDALFVSSVSGKSWHTQTFLVQNSLVFHPVGPS